MRVLLLSSTEFRCHIASTVTAVSTAGCSSMEHTSSRGPPARYGGSRGTDMVTFGGGTAERKIQPSATANEVLTGYAHL